MNSLDMYRQLFSYNYALFDKIWESILVLSDAQFVQDIDYSHGSIRNQMVHVINTEVGWLRGLQGDPQARKIKMDPKDYPTCKSTIVLWDIIRMQVLEYLDSLDEDDLEIIPPGMKGPVWQVLLHLINHSTDHRAQVLRALHDLGAPTFNQDLIFYLW